MNQRVLGISATSGIYMIKNIVTGQSYIGSASNMMKRCNAHRCYLNKGKHANIKLQRSFLKYSAESFITGVVEFVAINELIERERLSISHYKPYFNIREVAESNRGVKLSEETKRRMSEAHKKTPMTEERKQILRQIQQRRVGVPVTGKVKESLKLGPLSMIGKPKSETTKEKIRQSKIGKKFNKETRRYECK